MLPDLTRIPEEEDNRCSYCRTRIASEDDHIFSKALRRRFPLWNNVTVRACHDCNGLKYTYRRVPDTPYWRGRLRELRELTGKRFYAWDGKRETLHPPKMRT